MAQASSKTKALVAALGALVDGTDAVHVAEVVRHEGPGILIPEGMDLDTGIQILTRKRDEENEFTMVSAKIPAFPYDGAHALKLAMEDLFGYVVSKRCGCGRNHNTDIKIVTDAKGTTVTVPWGQFQVPNIDGHLQTSYTWEGERVVFQIAGEIRGKSKKMFDLLVAKTNEMVRTRSIYKNKAFSIRFKDDKGNEYPVPEIMFQDVTTASQPIYSDALTEQFQYDVMAYIEHAEVVRPLNGGTLKRGVLFAGPYGTGKTLAAAWMARRGVENGWTYIYVTDPNDFYAAHLLARAYQPAIVFVEDVDKIAGTDRTHEVDRLLNTLDGTDTKRLDIVTVFTTNHGDKITQAMYRPGRVDFLFRSAAPDAKAARRIAISYAQGRIDGSEEDFVEAGERLAGNIPATIKEAVARAQIRAAVRSGKPDASISNQDLVYAATVIEEERNTYKSVEDDDIVKLGRKVGAAVLSHTHALVRNGQN